MAGDWIKMRTNLRTHPKVVRIASALHADTLRTIGGLWSVWCLFDSHSSDGGLIGYTSDLLDEQIAWPGFAEAMKAVEWLQSDTVEGAPRLLIPEFQTHNGSSAKRRAQEADRKRIGREESASDADKMRTREEKNREEYIPHNPPEGEIGWRMRLCSAFGHRNERLNDQKLNRAWKNALASGDVNEETVILVERWYALRKKSEAARPKGYWKRDSLVTLLNNWGHDVTAIRDRMRPTTDDRPAWEKGEMIELSN